MSAERTNLIQNRHAELWYKRWICLPMHLFWWFWKAKFGGMKRIYSGKNKNERCVINMLWTIAIVLVGLWLLGVVTSYTLGGFIHILLVLAIIAVLIRLIRGKRVMGR